MISNRLNLFHVLVALAVGAPLARAQDATVPDDFATISAALANATDANTDGTLHIRVRSGTYNENVRVSRSSVILEGESANPPTIQGDGTAHVLHVETLTSGFLNDVTIKNFKITGGNLRDGVELSRVNLATIENVEAFGNAEGLHWNRGTGGSVRLVLGRDNSHSGIKLSGVFDATVANNVGRDNGSNGIDVTASANVVLELNDCHHNADNGLRARRATDLTVRNNLLHDNVSNGARVESVTRLQFTGNTCDLNQENGIRTRNTFDCLFSLNTLTNNDKYGVRRRDAFGDDWDAVTAGDQGPVGDNTFAGNASGEVRND
ncbi:MAG: right-handed parallel beta-helix repeat-containing protein [Planctomycetes bacterium]|nr:right-handed parallel beta-helix repeat-containing protein [Planctomycetota bacterium]